jgi:hypothetical protein
VRWLKEILLTPSRLGVQWNKACREEGGEGKGGGALNYRGTPRRVRGEDVEQLEDGPLCRYEVTEDCLLNFLRASPLPFPAGGIEQLEDGPLCRYKVTEDCLLNFLRASPLPAPYSAPAMAAPSFGDMAERNIVDLPSAGCRIE